MLQCHVCVSEMCRCYRSRKCVNGIDLGNWSMISISEMGRWYRSRKWVDDIDLIIRVVYNGWIINSIYERRKKITSQVNVHIYCGYISFIDNTQNTIRQVHLSIQIHGATCKTVVILLKHNTCRQRADKNLDQYVDSIEFNSI